MNINTPSMTSRAGEKMRRIRLFRGCSLCSTRVLGFCVTVTKALRTHVPFNYVGRLDSCFHELVCWLTAVGPSENVAQRKGKGKKSKGKRQDWDGGTGR